MILIMEDGTFTCVENLQELEGGIPSVLYIVA